MDQRRAGDGRALKGVGVGLTAGPSTAADVEFSEGGASRRTALITTVAQAAGFAAGLLLGGALIQYAPWPTCLSFWVLAALLAPVADRGRAARCPSPDRRGSGRCIRGRASVRRGVGWRQ